MNSGMGTLPKDPALPQTTARKCHAPQTAPMVSAARTGERRNRSAGVAKPVHPSSSKNPAPSPKPSDISTNEARLTARTGPWGSLPAASTPGTKLSESGDST